VKAKKRNRKTNAQIGSAIRQAVIAVGGKRNDAELLVGNQPLLAKLAAMIVTVLHQVSEVAIASITHSYSVLLDATKSLADLITLGRYDWINPDITAEHFPVKSRGKRNVRVELWWPNKYFKNGDEVIAELAKLNDELAQKNASYRYRFAFIEELLALGASQPELQRQFPIAALGSIWLVSDRIRRFACLYGGGAERVLGLGWMEYDFRDGWRFALVREPARIA